MALMDVSTTLHNVDPLRTLVFFTTSIRAAQQQEKSARGTSHDTTSLPSTLCNYNRFGNESLQESARKVIRCNGILLAKKCRQIKNDWKRKTKNTSLNVSERGVRISEASRTTTMTLSTRSCDRASTEHVASVNLKVLANIHSVNTLLDMTSSLLCSWRCTGPTGHHPRAQDSSMTWESENFSMCTAHHYINREYPQVSIRLKHTHST